MVSEAVMCVWCCMFVDWAAAKPLGLLEGSLPGPGTCHSWRDPYGQPPPQSAGPLGDCSGCTGRMLICTGTGDCRSRCGLLPKGQCVQAMCRLWPDEPPRGWHLRLHSWRPTSWPHCSRPVQPRQIPACTTPLRGLMRGRFAQDQRMPGSCHRPGPQP